MKSPDVRIAEIRRDREIVSDLLTVLTNPVVMLVAGFAAVEYLQSHPVGKPLMGTVSGTALQAAMVAPPLLEALGKAAQPLLPSILGSLVK